MSDLKQKSIDAIILNLIEKYGIQIFNLIIGVVLARILSPNDYGIIGIITVFLALAVVFMNSGFGYAFIQKKDANDVDASSIFYFNLIVGVILYVVTWICSPYIANFYNHEELKLYLRVMSVVLITNSLSMMHISILTKNIDFGKKTIINILSSLISGIVGVLMALSGYGVWSLIVQQLSLSSLRAIGLWYSYDWRPKLIISFSSLKYLFSFGSWILLSNLNKALFDNLNALVIGKFFPIEQLGFFSKAMNYQKTVAILPASAIGAVSFPVFSNLQGNKHALKNSMKKFLEHLYFFIVPIIVTLIIVAKPLIIFVLTEKWSQMIPYFQGLLILGLFYPMNLLNVQMLLSQGLSKLNLKINLIKNILKILNIFIMYRFGVMQIIYGEVFLSFLFVFINGFYNNKIINYGPLDQFKDLIKLIIPMLGCMILGYLSSMIILDMIYSLVIGIVVTFTSFYLLLYIYDDVFFIQNIQLVKSKLVKSKSVT